MAAGDYTITATIDAWTVTLDKGDATDPAADAVTMDPLRASWSLKAGYPSQPTPTVVSFGLWVPDIAIGPRPVQGSAVEITITTPDHALPDVRPVFEFVGLVTDVDASPQDDGLAFSIVAADHRTSLGEERIGDDPWPEEFPADRLTRIIEASALNLQLNEPEAEEVFLRGLGPKRGARDVDTQPTGELLDDLFAASATWHGNAATYWTSGYPSGGPVYQPPRLTTWVRAIVGQSVDAGGTVSHPIVFIPGGAPDVDAALPYTVALVGGVLELVRKPITPDTSLVCWIPAAAVDAASVRWHQTKTTNTNRVRAISPDSASITAEFADLVESNRPNEVTVNMDSSLSFVTEGGYSIVNLIHAMLGTHYDASPRWALDEITIHAKEIASGDQWPRLFDPREHTHIYDQAPGRFVLITDCADKWNLHDRGDYFGRLAGASMELSGGEITWTASLAHRLPVGVGVESEFDTPTWASEPSVYTGPPTHHPITGAELAAGANPTYAQCGDLTCADLELVEG